MSHVLYHNFLKRNFAMKRVTCFFLLFLSVFVFLYARPGQHGPKGSTDKHLARVIRHRFGRRLENVRKHMQENGKSEEEIEKTISQMRLKFKEEAEKIKDMPEAEKILYLQKKREKQLRKDLKRKGLTENEIEDHVRRMKERQTKMLRKHQDRIITSSVEQKRKKLKSNGLSDQEIQTTLSEYRKKIYHDLTGKKLKHNKSHTVKSNSPKPRKNNTPEKVEPVNEIPEKTEPADRRERRDPKNTIAPPVSSVKTNHAADVEKELDQVKSDIKELKQMIRELKEIIQKREGQ